MSPSLIDVYATPMSNASVNDVSADTVTAGMLRRLLHCQVNQLRMITPEIPAEMSKPYDPPKIV